MAGTEKMKQFMVRILRNGDTSDFADVVVDDHNEFDAAQQALKIVKKDPSKWFSDEEPPTYSVDETSDVEELDGTEYESAKP